MSYQVYKMFLLLYALGNVSVVYVGVVSCASVAHIFLTQFFKRPKLLQFDYECTTRVAGPSLRHCNFLGGV